MKVLVIIPAYNEQDSILGVVSELKATCPQYDYVVVNDCSTDLTREILVENGINHINIPVNLGIGGGVQTGFRYAAEHGYDVAVQMDGDGQHMPQYLPDVIGPVERGEADLCIGSRFIDKEGFQTSFMRRVGINFLRGLIYMCCRVKATDATSGFRASSGELIRFFAANYAQDYPEPEAIVAAVISGFRVAEVPVVMRERQGGKSSISTLRSAYFMVKVSIAIVLGRFAGKGGRRNG